MDARTRDTHHIFNNYLFQITCTMRESRSNELFDRALSSNAFANRKQSPFGLCNLFGLYFPIASEIASVRGSYPFSNFRVKPRRGLRLSNRVVRCGPEFQSEIHGLLASLAPLKFNPRGLKRILDLSFFPSSFPSFFFLFFFFFLFR